MSVSNNHVGAQVIAIVDPYSSGKLLAPEFHRLGVNCLAIHSQPDNSEAFSSSYQPEHFVASLDWRGDVDALCEQLAHYPLVNIIPGTESGVRLADQLASRCGFSGNDMAMAEARRDKYQMQETLRKAGVRAIGQHISDSLPDILNWVKTQSSWPAVLKPCESAGSDGVYICANPREVEQAFDRILGQKNLMGLVNKAVLVQEFIRGTEYVVDTVSHQGRHFTTNLCVYNKDTSKGVPVYREMHFLDPDKPELQALVAYTHSALDALGIRQGPAHSEVLLTETGPVLVETGARVHGGYTPYTVQQTASHSQLELTAQCYAAAESFKRSIQQPAKFIKHTAVLFFTFEQQGVVKALPKKQELAALDSHFDIVWNTAVGKTIIPTRDLYTSPGWIVLAHQDAATFERDLAYVKQLNATGALVALEA